MGTKHTVDTDDEVEELWLEYKKKYHASFSPMANAAILKYLKDMLVKK